MSKKRTRRPSKSREVVSYEMIKRAEGLIVDSIRRHASGSRRIYADNFTQALAKLVEWVCKKDGHRFGKWIEQTTEVIRQAFSSLLHKRKIHQIVDVREPHFLLV